MRWTGPGRVRTCQVPRKEGVLVGSTGVVGVVFWVVVMATAASVLEQVPRMRTRTGQGVVPSIAFLNVKYTAEAPAGMKGAACAAN